MSASLADPDTSIARRAHSRRGSVVLSLARFELPRLLRHPGMLLGLAFAVLLIVTAGPWGGEPGEPVIEHLTWGLAIFPVPVAVTFALLGSRSRRNGTTEVEEATAAGPPVRQSAAIVLTVIPATLATIAGTAAGALAEVLGANKAGMFIGAIAAPSQVVLLQAAVAATAICCFALAVGTWLPHWITAALMVVVVLQGADTTFHPTAWDTSIPIEQLLWHLAYGAGIAMILAAVALLRHRRDVVVAVIAVSGIALTTAGGILQ